MGYNKERYRTLKSIAYYIVLGVWYVISLLPFRVLYILSDIMYFFVYYVVGYRKRVVHENLVSSFPNRPDDEMLYIERDFYHFLCDYVVESLKLMTISEKNLKKRMVFKGVEQLNQCIEEGQSCAIYMGHYCNWEWVSSLQLWISPKGQCGQVYHPLENLVTDRLFTRLRGRHGSVNIPMQETLRFLLKCQQEKQPVVVGYLADQKPYWTNIHHWVNFLNHDTPVLTGTDRILHKMNHAAFYLKICREDRGYYEGEFILITREPKKMREFELTDIYYQMLENNIRRHPGYWLWSHKRWSRTREEFNRLYEVVDGKVIKKGEEIKED